jgi:hypothetical protein
MDDVFSARVLSKHVVRYYQCPRCRLLQTETPYWLEDAYRESYTSADTGLAARSLHNRLRLEAALHLLFAAKGRYLDVGGGCGLFTRLMRDIGFDCYTTDKYARNLLARDYEPNDSFKATALFAFEVLEHVVSPREFLTEMFEKYACRTLFFTTETFTEKAPGLEWPYYGFHHGQHVSFYADETLDGLAASLGCRHMHLFSDLHLITPLQMSPLQRFLLTHRLPYFAYALVVRARRWGCSKTQSDSQAAAGPPPQPMKS